MRVAFLFVIFFFSSRRRHTRYWRDWSSDVCSSDLASSEILAQVAEHTQGTPQIRWQRMGFAPVPCPTTKNLENLFYPNAQTVASTAFAMVHDNQRSWTPVHKEAPEIVEFKGPF